MSIRIAIFTAAALLLGCFGDPAAAIDGDAPGTRLFQRAMVDGVGDLVCEPVVNEDSRCVDEATGDSYQCKTFPGSSQPPFQYCAKLATPWTPPCDDFRQMGDHKGGLDCWAPPANYCAYGSANWRAWYCKADGSKCCYTDGCFKCGWIEIQSCLDEGAGVNLEPAGCAAIRAVQPPAVAACLVDMPGPDCVLPDPEAEADPECSIDRSLLICP